MKFLLVGSLLFPIVALSQLPGLPQIAPDRSDEIAVVQSGFHEPAVVVDSLPVLHRHGDPRNIRCHQRIVRYIDGSHYDIVDSIVSYESGHEEYLQIRRNGKPASSIHPGKRAAWITGDFAGLLAVLPDVISYTMAGHEYLVEYTLSTEESGTIAWTATNESLPNHVASMRITLTPATNGVIPVSGSFDLTYEDGHRLSNRTTWDACQVYGAGSSIVFTKE